ncbi:hypothetical protein GCM10009837_58840 [Streptomyces durmitorensis]|uniref:Uncharacterized protein n=1 Tax=Streptomyces durmitorensis TaxID=319947 RepID=A0ABY4PRX2_9ACTN|nr:hypothetical protein [Streptomyces durmitorensis]UQT55969.1 hypothetical protein M4V62_13125 [Streptomyces durmitorensis]
MPTVDVSSTPLTPSARLRAALRLTRWMAAHGSAAAHVVVSFRTAEPMAYFAGGMPLTAYGDGMDEDRRARWASVVCHVHPDRDHAYRAELAEEVREALGLDADTAHLTVRFEPTQPDRVFYLESGSMTSGGPPPAGRSQEKGSRYAHH